MSHSTQECQMIRMLIVLNCTCDTTRSLSWAYFFFAGHRLPADAWRKLAVCIVVFFAIPHRMVARLKSVYSLHFKKQSTAVTSDDRKYVTYRPSITCCLSHWDGRIVEHYQELNRALLKRPADELTVLNYPVINQHVMNRPATERIPNIKLP